MKKSFLLFIGSAITASVIFISCTKSASQVAAINDAIVSTNGTKLLSVDSTLQLKDTVSGGIWATSDSTVATVTQTGLLTGIKAGIIVVSYVVEGSNTFTVYDTVSVTANTTVIPITGGNSLTAGTTLQLSDNSSGGTWVSSDSTVAAVSSTGLVTGIATGSCTITYIVNNAYANFTAAEVLMVQ